MSPTSLVESVEEVIQSLNKYHESAMKGLNRLPTWMQAGLHSELTTEHDKMTMLLRSMKKSAEGHEEHQKAPPKNTRDLPSL